jgi:uncharacterized Zn finger protein
MAIEFGATPWGRAWLRTIESTTVTTPNPLLPKARSLARNDAVTALTTATGHVEAEVVVRDVTHHVHIQLPRWAGRTQADATELLAAALTGNIGLAPGDLPDALEADLNRHGIDIAVATGEQDADCTCPTRRTDCVHVLATLYTLVQRIDETPALAISLRTPTPEPAEQPDPGWMSLTDINAADFYGRAETGCDGASSQTLRLSHQPGWILS